MKKLSILKISVLAVALSFANSANAVMLAIGDAYYLGSIDNGIPSSGSNELDWLNEIIASALDTSFASTNPAGETLYRSANTFGGITLSAASNADKDENDDDREVETNTAYALGKYGGGNDPAGQITHVWYVGSLPVGTTLDLSDARSGLSHTTLFDGTRTSVPEGGATLGLLGLSLMGITFARRLRRK